VIAFALGAIAERVASEGGGLLVPIEDGAEGVAAVLGRVLAGEVVVPAFRGERAGSSARRAAEARSELYRTLLAETQ